MGFKQARAAVLASLRSGNYSHWPRSDYLYKNWLAAGRMTEDEVIRLLVGCRGNQHRPGNQKAPNGNAVHEFFPEADGVHWYIKAYLNEESGEATIEAVFMSIHPSGV
jgi:hypothetical protein